jgi:hypothetical protein
MYKQSAEHSAFQEYGIPSWTGGSWKPEGKQIPDLPFE